MEAAGEARGALETLSSAMESLKEVQAEYEEWQDNLPESGGSDATREKLAAVCEIDFDCLSEVEEAIDQAEGAELPLGFGRD